MIEVQIKRDSDGVEIGLSINGAAPFWFSNTDGPDSNWDCLLRDSFERELATREAWNREAAYTLGWNDAKKKRKKKTNFNDCFNALEDLAWED